AWYITMAQSLLRHGEFVIPWQSPDAPVAYTQHFPPLYPAFLALFFLPFGPSLTAVQVANLCAAALLTAVAFFCTRDLYGRRLAFAVGAIAATLPTLLFFDHEALSETFVAALFTLTIWAIIKSLSEPRYIVLGGLFAGLGYLAKASMGPFFLLAGAAGFLWRFLYVRWRVFTDVWYLLAAGLFASLVLPWAARNVLRHGWPNWHTQRAAQLALDALWQHERWWLLVLIALGWVSVTLLLHALPFLSGAATTLRDWRRDRTSGLLLAVVTPLLVAGFFVAAFSVVENFKIVESPHPARYAITPIVPLLWLTMRDLPWDPRALPGAPTTGAALVRRSRALVVAGAAVIALTLAFREPWYQAQRPDDVVLLIGGAATGLALIGAARLSAWQPLARQGADGIVAWRAIPRKLPRHAPWLAAALFVVAWLLTNELLPLALAAAAAALAATWRQRALVVAIVFLGWGLGGGINAQAYDLAADTLAVIAPPGATVATTVGVEPMLWPFLPEHVRMVSWGDDADYLVMPWGDVAPPDGYELVDRYGKHATLGPASWLRWRAELLLKGHEVGEPVSVVSLVQRAGAA
ncbi:MAG TPA: glycosyltransferase family 39 protein, partial [Candidatus Thermoplasmatota archaeon]|nr:glycosyltransferase family 39 protein [Candidatus Thermoplasmatota archaeon]